MNWITREAALALLQVKPQTLYAYVSRGMISAQSHPDDPRASLYAKADIDALVRKRRRGRARADIASAAIAWGDPIMETAITTVRNGRLIYRGRDAVRFAQKATLEDAAALLCEAKSERSVAASAAGKPAGRTGKARAMVYLAIQAASGPPTMNRSRAGLAADGMGLLAGFASAVTGTASADAFHLRLGRFWRLDPAGTDLLRRALVLVADHELNPSTFAARTTAATGASLGACALSGCATLTGPRHGEASIRALAYLKKAQTDGGAAALAEIASCGKTIPGVGHALYPMGDPRAAALLRWVAPATDTKNAIQLAEEAGGGQANLDMALAALVLHLDLPQDAPFLIFASGRMVGWIAHAIEQSVSGKQIRPRAKYVGR